MEEILLTHPISPKELLWFLSRGFDDPIYRVAGNSIFRAFKLHENKFLVKITPHVQQVQIEWLYGEPTIDTQNIIKNFIAEWFDLYADIAPFYELLKAHPGLSYMATEFNGLKLVGMPDLFEALVWAIIGQQINLTFAYKIKRRLVEEYGDFIDHENTRYYTFPSPLTLLNAETEELRAMQISGSKIAYLKNIAAAFADGKLDKDILKSLTDVTSRRNLLIEQKGIGVWTANYVLMKCLRDQSAIPFGDVGLINALLNHKIIQNKTELNDMHLLFETFKGWEAYLVFYLWRSLAPKPDIT